MRYENEAGEPLDEKDIDLNLGRVREERRLVAHHEATPEVPEQGHWQDVLKDGQVIGQTWVVDVEYQPAREAWDEYEWVGVYVPFTAEELEENAAELAEFNRTAAVAEQSRTAVMILVAAQSASLSDSQAAGLDALFADWTVGTDYKTGDIVRYQSGLWRCLQPNIGQDIYPPDGYVAGWKRIGEPGPGGLFEWSQPLCSEDSYSLGDRVRYDGKVWESTVPGEHTNTWEPGVYGWREVADAGEGCE